MITLLDISLQRGSKPLLENTSLTIYPGQKVGLIGANGSGKSSLFKLLLGQLHTDSGSCNIPKQWRIAHMAQEVRNSDRTAVDYILDGDVELRRLQRAIDSQQIEGEELAKLYGQMEIVDGYTATARAQQLLHGLGFTPSDEARAVSDFSGGWRIRLNLAQALMCPSDLLLLDEPTNHLDLDTTLWLEKWLQSYPGTLIIVSHDRDFLDNVINYIVSIESHTLIAYNGNYSAFEQQKAQRLAQQQAAFEKQQQRIGEIEKFVRRFRAKATKARQAQSRLKELERMELIAPAHINSPFNFSIPAAEKISTPLLAITDATIGYNNIPLISGLNFSILPESRIGLLGPNGAGKSTLIKTLAGQLPLLKGKRVDGENLAIGYFAQHQLEALDLEASPALHLQRLSPKVSEQAIRSFLGGFGFHGDRAFEVIQHFSGGEKARLALALITWQRPNLLLLDEPTNHLDLEMRHALTIALQGFEGAILVVSHDRHLLRNTVDDFLLVSGGKLEPFDGDLEDYQRWMSCRDQDGQPQQQSSQKRLTDSRTGSQSKSDKREQRQAAATRREKLQPLTQELKRLEKAMEKLTSELATLEQKLVDPSLYEGENPQLQALLIQQGSLRQQLSQAEEHWLSKSEELEHQQAQM